MLLAFPHLWLQVSVNLPLDLLLLAVAAMASGVERLFVLWLLPWLLLGGHEEEAPPSAWDEVGEIETSFGAGPLGSTDMPSTTSSVPYTYENLTMYMMSAWDENISIGLQEEEIVEAVLPPPGPHEVPLPTWSLAPSMEHAPEVSSTAWWTCTPTSSSWTSASSSTVPHMECPEQDPAGVNPEHTSPTWSLAPSMEHTPEVSSTTWWTSTPTSSSWTAASSSTVPHMECPEQDQAGVNPEHTSPPETLNQGEEGKHATCGGLVGGDQGHPCSSTRRS